MEELMNEIRKNLTGNSARDNKYLEKQILKHQDSEIAEAIYNEFLN